MKLWLVNHDFVKWGWVCRSIEWYRPMVSISDHQWCPASAPANINTTNRPRSVLITYVFLAHISKPIPHIKHAFTWWICRCSELNEHVMFLRNADIYVPNYKAPRPRTPFSSTPWNLRSVATSVFQPSDFCSKIYIFRNVYGWQIRLYLPSKQHNKLIYKIAWLKVFLLRRTHAFIL